MSICVSANALAVIDESQHSARTRGGLASVGVMDGNRLGDDQIAVAGRHGDLKVTDLFRWEVDDFLTKPKRLRAYVQSHTTLMRPPAKRTKPFSSST